MLYKIANGLIYFFGTLTALNMLAYLCYFIYAAWNYHTDEEIIAASHYHLAFIGTILVLGIATAISVLAKLTIELKGEM